MLLQNQKRQATDWKNTFVQHISIKVLESVLYKGLFELTNKKATQWENEQNSNRSFTKENT